LAGRKIDLRRFGGQGVLDHPHIGKIYALGGLMSHSMEQTHEGTLPSPSVATVTDDRRDPLPRRIYLSLRLKELVAELQALVTERQNLNTTIKDHASESSKDVHKMRERRGYLAIRINVLRAEQQGLAAEKEALPPILKPQIGEKNKAKVA
jgi:hypothetical protein